MDIITMQWIADVFKCETSREPMTTEAMKALLTETETQKFPDDFSPDPSLFRECCEYWNTLYKTYH